MLSLHDCYRYPPTQFGFWFACLSTASNLIGTIGPGIATAMSVTYGWRTALQYPALLVLVCSGLIPFCTWDKPSDVGYEDQLTLGGSAPFSMTTPTIFSAD